MSHNHIGEKFQNNQGFMFEIIDGEYRNMTVRFEDGTIKTGCNYQKLQQGICPKEGKTNHIGERFINKQGLSFEIIGGAYANMTVRFEDGVEKSGYTYQNIKKGICPHPNQKNHIGERFKNEQGLMFEIVGGTLKNMTVRFEDGVEKSGCRYAKLKEGKCPHPKYKEKHIGERFINKQGLPFEIVDGSYTNMTVRFEDGTIKTGCNYGSLKKGSCPHPNWTSKKNHIGERFVNKQGQSFEIIDGDTEENMTVRFEDGATRTGCQYRYLKKGSCLHPSQRRKASHTGERFINKQGLSLEIIGGTNTNMTVRFEDGTEKSGCYYSSIKKGICPHPSQKDKTNHIGERLQNNQGYWFEIIGGSYRNMTVRFDDGTIRTGCNYKNLQEGVCPKEKIDHIGERFKNNQGIWFEITSSEYHNMTVRFDDGAERTGCEYGSLQKGCCLHPTFEYNKTSKFAGFITAPRSLVRNGESYYTCVCEKCGLREFFTPAEMIEHHKECSKESPE